MHPTEVTLDRTPPHSIEAERSMLGAILLDPGAINKIIGLLEPEDFYAQTHQDIFRSILSLYQRNIPIDLVTLKEELKGRGILDQAGGLTYLTSLLEATPTAVNVKTHACLVREKSLARRLIQVGTQIATRGYEEGEEVESLLENAEHLIYGISEKKIQPSYFPIKDILTDCFHIIEGLYEKKERVSGLSTGFVDLDAITSGLQKQDLIIIAARPSMGKTSFCLNIALHVSISEKQPVLLFSLETAKEQIGLRLLCSSAMVNAHHLRTGFLTERDWEKLIKAAALISEAPIYIDDTASPTVLEIRAKARRLMKERGVGLIIVDYLQLIQGRVRSENRQQEISEISRSLKGVAKELNCPLIALSQLSRAVESRTDRRPILSDLRESGAIEQDGDLVAFIYRPEIYHPDTEEAGIAEIIIGKQRNGPVGTVKLAFLKEFTRFENLSHSEDVH
ncbi:replicative DNA helicase [bacterium]|nr:replicative DNA helicase [bacterium]